MTALNLTWSLDLEGSTFNDHWHFTDRENQEQILEKSLSYLISRMHEISELSQMLFQEPSDLEVF